MGWNDFLLKVGIQRFTIIPKADSDAKLWNIELATLAMLWCLGILKEVEGKEGEEEANAFGDYGGALILSDSALSLCLAFLDPLQRRNLLSGDSDTQARCL
ncbi:hypothetical protein Cni_G28145 [Canna indica]|uniref:Uncharacterized protein n=1 Tax=Canna indica TaxID=4628 RepID=A0AAQ3L231_9LILI|nr:hypothetical protein Cni_G28145 [Canna indica]